MGAVMHPPSTSEAPRNRLRGRLQLILILLVRPTGLFGEKH